MKGGERAFLVKQSKKRNLQEVSGFFFIFFVALSPHTSMPPKTKKKKKAKAVAPAADAGPTSAEVKEVVLVPCGVSEAPSEP